jgi:uncharacterized membrane protein (UPF0127 family)
LILSFFLGRPIVQIQDLTPARDRSHKKALPAEQALEILRGQADRGLLDADLLELFTAGRIYEKAVAAPR